MTALPRPFARLACSLAVIVGVTAVAACSSDSTKTSTGGAGATSTTIADGGIESVLTSLAAKHLDDGERASRLYAAAKREGKVVLYGSPNLDVLQAWQKGFDAAYPGVKLEFVRLQSNDLLERLPAEEQAGRHLADVVSVDAVTAVELHAKGLFADIHGVPVPSGLPKQYVNGWSAIETLAPTVFAWNTKSVPAAKAPHALDDFLRPDLEGCAISSRAEAFTAGLVLDRGEAGAAAWFKAFFANGGVVVGNNSTAADSVASGEYPCVVDQFAHSIEELAAKGAPVDWYAPQPTPTTTSGVYLSAKTSHPNAAALLMLWLLGHDAGQILADTGRLTTAPGVTQKYVRMRPFTDAGTDLHDRMQLLLPAVAEKVSASTRKLINEFVVPNQVKS